MLRACESGDLATARELRAQGAAIDVKDNNAGLQPMHLACEYGHRSVAEWLQSKGVAVDVKDNNGRQPMHAACERGHRNVAEWLHAKGVAVDVKTNDGRAPIDFARNQSALVAWLESALKQPPGAEDDVIVVGMRTPAERNAAGCKRAISLESPLESIKRSKTASLALQTDVVTARSINTADHEKRFKELFQPAFDAYCKDEIDVVELDRRKKAAQETAGTDYPPLTALDAAFSAYEAAVKAREDAEEAAEKMLANAHAAEDAAEAQVRSLLAQSAAFPSAGGAGPSGVVKSE